MHRRLLATITTLLFLLLISSSLTAAQDYGAGFVFKCTRPGIVALTFDDGPSLNTDQLLGFLADANIKATFFVIGNSISNMGDSGLKRAYSAGHQIGLHTTTHPHLNDLTAAQQVSEMKTVQEIVYKSLNVTPNYMRPPFGECQDTCRKTMQDLGYTVTQWNVDSDDWRYINATPSVQDELTKDIADQISPKGVDSYIVLQHEIDAYSVSQVPAIISAIAAKGYQFVTIAECNGNNPPPYLGIPADNGTTANTAASGESNSINFNNSTNSTSSSGANKSGTGAPLDSTTMPTQHSAAVAINLSEMNKLGTFGIMALLAGVMLFSSTM